MADNETKFSRFLAQTRLDRGMSQGQLAQATRLSRTYIFHLETGQRAHPTPYVVQNIARALELSTEERDHFYQAYTELTGQHVDVDHYESELLDFGELAMQLVQRTSVPAHSLDRLWYLHSWNTAVIDLFELQERVNDPEPIHLLALIFDPNFRRRLYGWEKLAHRLVRDFLYNTRTVTHLPEYKELWKELRTLPEFRRIATVVYPKTKPAPSFVFQVQHSRLGRLTLRTATTAFAGISSYTLVSYVPGDQQTLRAYQALGW